MVKAYGPCPDDLTVVEEGVEVKVKVKVKVVDVEAKVVERGTSFLD